MRTMRKGARRRNSAADKRPAILHGWGRRCTNVLTLALAVPPGGPAHSPAPKIVVSTRLGPYAVTWDAGDFVQFGRPFRDGRPVCGNGRHNDNGNGNGNGNGGANGNGSLRFPGLASSGEQLCEIYRFINNAAVPDTISVTQTGVTDVNAFFSAWLEFTPGDLMAHGRGYLGDAGFSYWPFCEFPRSFSFLVPARTVFLVVANSIEGVHSRGGAYTFTVSGTDVRQSFDSRRPANDITDALREVSTMY